MNLVEMRERMTALLTELGPLAQAGERSADQEARIDAILAEVNDLGPRIEREANIAATAARTADYTQPVGRVSGVAASEQRAEATAPDRRSVGRRFTSSDKYRMIRAGATGKQFAVEVGEFFPSKFRQEADELEQRAVISSGTASTSMLLPTVLPGIYRGLEKPLVMRDVLLNMRTTSDSITVMQESGFTNSAAEVAEATATDGVGLTGGVKPESALTFTEVSFPVRTIAHWVPITRQMLEDLPAMETYINDRLLTGLERREDAQIINGNGTPPNLTGILQTNGIQVLDGAYFTANAVSQAGSGPENFNRILRAKTKIATTGAAQATFIVMNPADFETLLTTADANKQYLVGGGPASGNIPTIWGLPVVQSEGISAGTALVGDGTMAAVADRSAAQIYVTDSHSDFFIRNLFVILAEERIALPVFRPAAFAKLSLATA